MDNTNRESLALDFIAKNIADARRFSGKTIKDCSLLLGIPTSRLKNYENGKFLPSLPELESLSFLLGIPVFVFFKKNGVSDYIHSPNSAQMIKLIGIRQQIIATKIRLSREAVGMTLNGLSKTSSIPLSRIKRYESGETAIPLSELKNILNILNLNLDDFFDFDSPIGEWQKLQSIISVLEDMPAEIQDFLLNQENQNFLLIASAISKIRVPKLHDLSNALSHLIDSIETAD